MPEQLGALKAAQIIRFVNIGHGPDSGWAPVRALATGCQDSQSQEYGRCTPKAPPDDIIIRTQRVSPRRWPTCLRGTLESTSFLTFVLTLGGFRLARTVENG